MRGKHGEVAPNEKPTRNIPAYAGKTVSGFMPSWCTAEHPRVRGENCCYQLVRGIFSEHPRVRGENSASSTLGGIPVGTSPRARGKPARFARRGRCSRNIPACAGKTDIEHACHLHVTEHPRVRGEN